jgi:hypothetical protein
LAGVSQLRLFLAAFNDSFPKRVAPAPVLYCFAHSLMWPMRRAIPDEIVAFDEKYREIHETTRSSARLERTHIVHWRKEHTSN